MTTTVGIYKDRRNKRRPWVVRWAGEFDPATGKQRSYTEPFTTKRAAESFRAAKQASLDNGEQRDRPRDLTVAELADQFMSTRGAKMRPATRDAYRRTLDQLGQYVGHGTLVRKVDPAKADGFIATRRNQRNGEPLSPWSRNGHRNNCNAVFKAAVEWGYIPSSPFETVKLIPQRELLAKDWHHITPPEFEALLSVAPDARWRALYPVLYTAGLRFGEAFSLTWADVDFASGKLYIRTRRPTAEMPPFEVKGKKPRTLLVPERTLDALAVWQAEAPEGVPLVFLTADRWTVVKSRWDRCRKDRVAWQNRWLANNVLRSLCSHAQRAGLELSHSMTVHTLRKSFGQNHADAGTPMHQLQKMMGHSKIETTRQFYIQHTDANDLEAMRRYEAVMATAQGDVKSVAEKAIAV